MVLGLPNHIVACLFDMDGVLTETATVHRAAWKEMFDGFLKDRDGPSFQPFDAESDYNQYVDGLPREAGVRDFLASRGITLEQGAVDDPPEANTVFGLGNRKNVELMRRIERDGVQAFDGSLRYLQAARDAGLRRVVVSSSANTTLVLERSGLASLVEGTIDALTLNRQQLAGKPAPDSFLAGAALVGVPPARAAVFEDALAGVAAGRAGKFGFVVGVDRVGHGPDLLTHGADTVVTDLAELLEEGP